MHVDDFGQVGAAYQAYSEGIRGRIRHELIFEAVSERTPAGGTILDMGCGDGEMSLRLAEAGFRVLGVDVSAEMLRRAGLRKAVLSSDVGVRVEFATGDIASFEPGRMFDAVCCHGVLMYLDNSAPAIRKLAAHVAPGGLLSIMSRNLLANGFREALRGDYGIARRLIETGEPSSLGNLGISTRADDPSMIMGEMEACGFADCDWQGVRIFSDHLDACSFEDQQALELIALERAASQRDPYRAMARLFHAMGRKAA